MRGSIAVAVLAVAASLVAAADQQATPFLGKWNMTGLAPDTNYVYWLEVKQSGDQLSGMFLNRSGNPVPVTVKVDNGELVFQVLQSPRGGGPAAPSGPEYRARLDGAKLVGSHTTGGRLVNWAGVRPPAWPAANANAKHTFGKPVVLADGKTLDAWTYQNPKLSNTWSIQDGTMTNAYPDPSTNIVSKEKFTDFKVEIEYKLPKGSNSGLYLRGRYELQLVEDSGDTTTPPNRSHMSIYGRTAPSVRAGKGPDEWQSMEAIVVANRRDGDAQWPTGPRQRGHRGHHRRCARQRRARPRTDLRPGRSQQGVGAEVGRDANH